MIASCVIGVFAFVGPFDLGFVGHHFIFVGEASLIVYALNRMHRAVREAETATRTRDHFMAIVSHDLRNPLSAIHMHVDTILRKDPGNRSALVMHRAVGKMERLIQQMVELVRSLSSGEIPLHIEPVCPKDILEEAIATISPSCPVHVQVEVDQGSTATAYWDRVKVDQIFTNMLTNACKYGGGKPIRVILDVHDVTVQVRVQDEGCGIPHEEKARLFRPYARMSNAKGRDGLGLGLWVTRQLAEMMGGSVEVESEEGRGTVFSVTLPRKVPGHV
jgi:signal transduction histidine kinase